MSVRDSLLTKGHIESEIFDFKGKKRKGRSRNENAPVQLAFLSSLYMLSFVKLTFSIR
jgi:hypothetical protein